MPTTSKTKTEPTTALSLGRARGADLLIYYLGGLYFDNDAELLHPVPVPDWTGSRDGVFFTE